MTDDLLISLMASPAAAGIARAQAKELLHKWDFSSMLDDALLVIAELVANASAETPGQEVRVRLSRAPDGLLISVWDSSSRLPHRKAVPEMSLESLDLSHQNLDDNGGWGIPIVQALSTANGCTKDPASGKWIWARISTVPS